MKISLVLGKGTIAFLSLSHGAHAQKEKGHDALSCFPNSRSTTPSHQPHTEIDATPSGWRETSSSERKSIHPSRRGPPDAVCSAECECYTVDPIGWDWRFFARSHRAATWATCRQCRLPTNRESCTADVSDPTHSHSFGSGISR